MTPFASALERVIGARTMRFGRTRAPSFNGSKRLGIAICSFMSDPTDAWSGSGESRPQPPAACRDRGSNPMARGVIRGESFGEMRLCHPRPTTADKGREHVAECHRIAGRLSHTHCGVRPDDEGCVAH